jgi:ribosomal protein S10
MVPLRYLQKIKRFVYYVHPMLIKTREHFELRLYKRFIDLNTTSQQF